ncbi:MAG: tRNA pseudouridine(55) synthase TruB [Usitatibacter sp.]
MAAPDGVLLLDKPPGYSSTRALARAKRLLGARKAGHTGTLDPFATGLLPLAFGEATKFSRFLSDSAKTYRATLQLGQETTTGDTEGTISARSHVNVSMAKIDAVLTTFMGFQDQIPPMHSAVHVDGRRLYELAREGLEVPRAARRVQILEIRRLSLEADVLVVTVTCSKGTYVRTLAMDIGRSLGCGAYLTALRRTAVAAFRIEDAVTLDELERLGEQDSRGRLLPLELMIAGLPRRQCNAHDSLRFTQGQQIASPDAVEGDESAVFDPQGRFLGVGRCALAGRLAPVRLLATDQMAKLPDFA